MMEIEGINYELNWSNFTRGYSFFIPCLDLKAARLTILRAAQERRIDTFASIVIEDGVQGLRIWCL